MQFPSSLFFALSRPLFHRAVTGRNRCRGDPSRGRFTKRDAARIFGRALDNYRRLFADMPNEKTVGSRAMLRSGVWSLAVYRAVREAGVEADYATELCTDYLWLGYRRQVGLQRLIARVFARDPQKQMNLIQRMFMRFPLAAPGYDCTPGPAGGGFGYDIRRCPVYDYYRGQDVEALRFFRNSWCTLDYPLAEHLVDGGRYERAHTLSAGDAVCDMRWLVDETRRHDPGSK